jgi:uncharacterized membrane protein
LQVTCLEFAVTEGPGLYPGSERLIHQLPKSNFDSTMQKFSKHLRSHLLAGAVFLIPLFVILVIVHNLFTRLTGLGTFLMQALGWETIFGINSIPVATAILLLILFYLGGWLVKLSHANRVRDWAENSVLKYVPGYLTYKAQMLEKINTKEDTRVPVLVSTAHGKRPGLLIDEQHEDAIVFFPNSPDSNNGEVLVVEKHQVTRLNINVDAFFKSMQNFGKDLSASGTVTTTVTQTVSSTPVHT